MDNMDLFALTLPLKFDGIETTPWVMYGMRGKNTGDDDNPKKRFRAYAHHCAVRYFYEFSWRRQHVLGAGQFHD
jgi:hypothetical protein